MKKLRLTLAILVMGVIGYRVFLKQEPVPIPKATTEFVPASLSIFHTLDLTPDSPMRRLLKYFGVEDKDGIQKIVEVTQEKWRQLTKERWELDNPYKKDEQAIERELESLPLYEKILPKQTSYKYGLVLGALYNTVQLRLDYLIELWEKENVRFDSVVLLSGERPLFENEKTSTGNQAQTEAEMVLWIYNHTKLPEGMEKLPVVLANAPMKTGNKINRPDRKDTIRTWLAMNPIPGSCISVSSQPHALYEFLAVRNVLPFSFSLETVGPEVTGKPTVPLLLDDLARVLFEYAEMVNKNVAEKAISEKIKF